MKYFLEELEAASRTNHFGANLQYDDLSADCAFDAEQDLPAIVEIENFDPIPLHKLVKCRTESPACVNSDLDKFIETAKRRKLTEEEIATMIVDELLANYVFGCDGNALRVYKPKRGYFKLCPLESTSGTSLTKLIMNKTSYGGSSLKKNVVEKVAKVLINKDGLAVKLEKQHADFVNLRDAAFCLQTETLHEHSPEIRATYYIDAVYTTEPMSEKSKAFFRHLGASTRGVTALFQIIGLALTNVRNLQTAGLLVGPPGSGKSVLLQFLQCVMSIGAAKTFEFSSMLKLSERTNLLGAQLSICSELSTDIIPAQAVALFKQITSGEKIQVRQLYKDVVDFKPNCFLLLCGNTLPAIEDESGAFERRLLTVETGPTIPESERNPHLLKNCSTIGTPLLAKHYGMLLQFIKVRKKLFASRFPSKKLSAIPISQSPTGIMPTSFKMPLQKFLPKIFGPTSTLIVASPLLLTVSQPDLQSFFLIFAKFAKEISACTLVFVCVNPQLRLKPNPLNPKF